MPFKSDSAIGSKTIIIATHATKLQGSRSATALVDRCKTASLQCYSCQRILPATSFDGSTSLCDVRHVSGRLSCYDEAGLENEHSDTDGKHDGRDATGCPTCAS